MPPRARDLGLAAVTVVLGLLVVGILVARLQSPPCLLQLWGDRDLVRAAAFPTTLRTTGAEMSYGSGACVPGGAGNALVAALRTFGHAPLTVQRGLYALDALALLLVAGLVHRRYGALAAVATALTWLGVNATDTALTQLWNPAYQPLFLALSVIGLHAFGAGGRPAWLGLWGLGVALAAHMHLSAGVWAAAGVVVVLLDGRPDRPRALGFALLGFLIPYVPHVVDELLHDFPNTRAMGVQPHVLGLDFEARHWRVDEVVPGLRVIGGHLPAARLPAWTGLLWPTGLVLAALGLVGSLRRAARGDAMARGAALVLSATALAYAWLAIDPFILTEHRYFLVVVPGLALGAGVGVRGVADRLGSAPAALAAVALAAAPTWWLDRAIWQPQPGPAEAEAALTDVGAATGWTWSEVAGRVILPLQAGDRFSWSAVGAIEDLLARHGAPFEGSMPPPCGALFMLETREEAERALRGLVVEGPDGLVTLGWERVGDHRGLLLYDPGTPLCPTSLTQRYVDRPWEAAARVASRDLPHGAVQPLTGPDGEGVLFVSAPGDPPMPRVIGVVRIAPTAAGPVALLESNQLRGEALNFGWFESGLVERPRLRFTHLALGTEVEVVLVDGLLGYRAAVAPVRTPLVGVGPGTWRAELLWERVNDPLTLDTTWPLGARERVPERFLLHEALTL